MVDEARIKEAFGKVKEDVEGVKNELAFALRRIAKIEEILNKKAVEFLAKSRQKPKKNRKARKFSS